jgi:hypothetical protein
MNWINGIKLDWLGNEGLMGNNEHWKIVGMNLLRLNGINGKLWILEGSDWDPIEIQLDPIRENYWD